jgi:hypothetical protein
MEERIPYSTLHQFIARHKNKPNFCEICNKNPPQQLGKITLHYTKNIEDYKYFCVKCHRKFDKRYASKQKAPQSALGNGQIILLRKKSKRIDKLK